MFNLVFLGVKTAADIHEHLESGKYEGDLQPAIVLRSILQW